MLSELSVSVVKNLFLRALRELRGEETFGFFRQAAKLAKFRNTFS
jgi:hypothetical protein